MSKNPSEAELREVITRAGGLSPEQQGCLLDVSAAFDDGNGLTAPSGTLSSTSSSTDNPANEKGATS